MFRAVGMPVLKFPLGMGLLTISRPLRGLIEIPVSGSSGSVRQPRRTGPP